MTGYLNEEEQLQLLKKWWNQYGNIAVSVILMLGLLFAAVNWWQNHSNKINTQASALYEQLLMSASAEDKAGVSAASQVLLAEYPKTIYASLASLFEAKQFVHQSNFDGAIKSLQWVAEHSPSLAVKQIAKIRLARIYLAEGKLALADQQLATVVDQTFLPIIHEVQGDLTLARGQPMQARTQYLEAQSGLQKQNIQNSILQMKINSLPATAVASQ